METTRPPTLVLGPNDSVAMALHDLAPGTFIKELDLVVRDRIGSGHKIARLPLKAGDPVIKYGEIIGFASREIRPGEHVHSHNLDMGFFARDGTSGLAERPSEISANSLNITFEGIVRPDHRVGTRNYVGVLATVNCSSGLASFIANGFASEILDGYPAVDGVVSLGHGMGCGMPSDGEGLRLLQRTLAGYARHPNFAGVLMVGLGCEVNQVGCLMENMGLKSSGLLQTIDIQKSGGTKKTVERGTAIVREMLEEANRAKREPVPAEKLILGLECGGSDAYSGLCANPLLGEAADLLVASGGTAILSETPEIYGAEHLLMRRAIRKEVAERLLQRIRWWEAYTSSLGGSLDSNPTPGNKEGGLTTILEKSLGAVSKAGHSKLMEVYGYADPVLAKGLVFMDTPGYDAVSITGMIAGGANIIGFTTGRGTVCGFKPVPTLKIASNSDMFQRMEGDMDVNAGRILDGETSLKEMGQELWDLILQTASGQRTKSEALGFGNQEFVPWSLGPVL